MLAQGQSSGHLGKGVGSELTPIPSSIIVASVAPRRRVVQAWDVFGRCHVDIHGGCCCCSVGIFWFVCFWTVVLPVGKQGVVWTFEGLSLRVKGSRVDD